MISVDGGCQDDLRDSPDSDKADDDTITALAHVAVAVGHAGHGTASKVFDFSSENTPNMRLHKLLRDDTALALPVAWGCVMQLFYLHYVRHTLAACARQRCLRREH